MSKDKKVTLDNNTYASNPGNIDFNNLVWLRYYFKIPFLIFLSLIASLLLMLMYSYYFSIMLLVTIVIHEFYWIRQKEHFTADSNGGVIISTSPALAAVSTNLGKYGGDYPVIKIIEFKVKRPISVGEKIATVAIYSGVDDEIEYWDDFYPLPVEYATKNQQDIKAALNSYPEKQWQTIKEGVAELKLPYKIGLYKVRKQNSDWIK
jgi:hypothetical protein